MVPLVRAWRWVRSKWPGCVLKTAYNSLPKAEMPDQDFIKGKADIFSFVMEVLDGIRKNGHRVTCGEIVDRIERYIAAPLLERPSADYYAGVADAMTHFRGYFVPREDVINSDAVKYIYNAVEERWEELYRQLESSGPKMTLAEMWASER